MEEWHTDLFQHGRGHYLVVVDKESGYPFIKRWNDSPSTLQVTKALLAWFADFGVPQRLRSDGGPQFRSAEMGDFLKRWNVERRMSSPYHPESNGRAEASVKAMKALIKHAGDTSSESFYRGLLEWRNTPKDHGRSPAMLVFGSQQRSVVPCPPDALSRPKSEEDDAWMKRRDDLIEKKRVHFNDGKNELSTLDVGDSVRVQDPKSGQWKDTGIITKKLKRRRYAILLEDGRKSYRNRKFIRPKLSPGEKGM